MANTLSAKRMDITADCQKSGKTQEIGKEESVKETHPGCLSPIQSPDFETLLKVSKSQAACRKTFSTS